MSTIEKNNNKFIEILFCLLGLSLPISGALTTGLWLVLFVATFFKFSKNPDKNLFIDKIHFPLYGFIFFTTLSIFFAINFSASIFEFKKTAQVFIMFIFIYNMKNDLDLIKKFVKYLFIGICIVVVLGIIQYVFGINSIHRSLVYVPEYLSFLPKKILSFLSLNDMRIQGTQSLHLTYAEILICSFTFFFYSILDSAYQKNSLCQKIKIYVLYFFMFLALIFGFCRGVWISMFVFFICCLIFQKKYRFQIFKMLLIYITILFCVIILLMKIPQRTQKTTWTDKGYFGFYEGENSKEQLKKLKGRFFSIKPSQNKDRLAMWDIGIKVWKDDPLLGVGPKNLKDVYNEYAEKEPNKYPPYMGHIHNTYLQILADRGIVGFLFYVAMLFTYMGYFFVNFKSMTNLSLKYLAFGGFSVILVFTIFSFTEYSFGDNEFVMLFWSLLGTSIAAISNYKTNFKS